MICFSKKESIVSLCVLSVLFFCFYEIGYLSAKLEKPKANSLSVKNLLNEEVRTNISDVDVDFNLENILYVSSDVLGKDDETLNRIGVRFVGFKNNDNLFFVEICDSVNKKCIESDTINRKELREKLENQFTQ